MKDSNEMKDPGELAQDLIDHAIADAANLYGKEYTFAALMTAATIILAEQKDTVEEGLYSFSVIFKSHFNEIKRLQRLRTEYNLSNILGQ
jgi:hypothetical protein